MSTNDYYFTPIYTTTTSATATSSFSNYVYNNQYPGVYFDNYLYRVYETPTHWIPNKNERIYSFINPKEKNPKNFRGLAMDQFESLAKAGALPSKDLATNPEIKALLRARLIKKRHNGDYVLTEDGHTLWSLWSRIKP